MVDNTWICLSIRSCWFRLITMLQSNWSLIFMVYPAIVFADVETKCDTAPNGSNQIVINYNNNNL